MKAEQDRIDDIAKVSLYADGVNFNMIEYSLLIAKRFINGHILEMGPGEGVMTDELVRIGKSITILEGTKIFANELRKKHPQAEVYCSLFEDFETEKKFDTIVLGHVLEHVENPVSILQKAKGWLAPEGIIFAAVPNSHSLHRQAAVIMGMLEKENSMSELDLHHGHRRVYSVDEFRNDFIQAGLNIKHCGGYWLKPVSNKQLAESWTPEMIDAFMLLGEKYPDIAAEIYIVAGKN